jgi:hypothetical protein
VVMELHINPSTIEGNTIEGVKQAFVQEIRDRVAQPPEITISSIVGVQQE